MAQQSWVNQLGTVATVWKKKKKRQNGSTKWHCKCTAQKHWIMIYKKGKKKVQIEDWRKKKKKSG